MRYLCVHKVRWHAERKGWYSRVSRNIKAHGFAMSRKRKQADLEALRAAGERLDALIAAAGTSEDELLEDFKEAHRSRTRKH
jgi:hypothetical protein